MAKKEKPTAESLAKAVRDGFADWKRTKAHGTMDPFWPDGTNLNLIRNHIFYDQERLRELCKEQGIRPCPKEARLRPPRRLSENYMAPDSKAAKHYTGKLRRRKARR